MSTVVISKWTATDAYRADPHIADEGLKLISDAEGVIANYHGVQVEDPNVGISVQVCTSPEAFLKVVTNKELYDTICDKLAATRIGDPVHYHGICVSDPLKALVGPFQEVSRLTLRNDTPETRAKLEEICAAHNKITEEKMTYAWCVEDPTTVLVLYSWDSPEVHAEYVIQPEIAAILKTLDELADMHGGPLEHVKFIKVK